MICGFNCVFLGARFIKDLQEFLANQERLRAERRSRQIKDNKQFEELISYIT